MLEDLSRLIAVAGGRGRRPMSYNQKNFASQMSELRANLYPLFEEVRARAGEPEDMDTVMAHMLTKYSEVRVHVACTAAESQSDSFFCRDTNTEGVLLVVQPVWAAMVSLERGTSSKTPSASSAASQA